MPALLRSVLMFARLALPVAMVYFMAGCASISPLEGGPKDETPPKVLEEESTPNFQANSSPRRIELVFDEWVTLTDVFNQVVISPPLQYKPAVSLKGRTVVFELNEKEQLRPDATYTINFGNAVKDLTENNPAENLRFVFSTGAYIDSLTVSGKIVSALTGEPVDKALFMLYDNLNDSVVRTELPFYFGRTDKNGHFTIPNVRADTLKGFALLDADLNYRFNQSKELIGFPDAWIVTTDSSARDLRIRLFEEARPIKLLEQETATYGVVKLTYSQTPLSTNFSASDTAQIWKTEYLGDSIKIWYDRPDTNSWKLFVRADTITTDTITPKNGSLKPTFLSKAKLSMVSPTPGATALLHPDKPATLTFNHPVVRADTSLISWWEDTLRNPVFPTWKPDSVLPRVWNVSLPWKEALLYEMQALPGAFTDMYGLSNVDTLLLKWRIEQRKNFATLHIIVEDMEPETDYIVSLLNSNKVEVDRKIMTSDSENKFTAFHLQPGQYSLRIVVDTNKNGRWDSGHYDTKIQPEEIMLFPIEQLRGNWETEAKAGVKKKE